MSKASRAAFLQPRLCEAQSGAKLLLNPSEECVDIGQDVTVKVCIKNLCALSTADDAPMVPAVIKAGAKLEAALACTTSSCNDLFKGVFEIDKDDPFQPAQDGLSWESGKCALTQHAWKRQNPLVRLVVSHTSYAYKRTSNERRCGGAWSPDSTEPITSICHPCDCRPRPENP